MPEGFLAMEVFFIAGVDPEPSGDALVAKLFVWALLAIASGYRVACVLSFCGVLQDDML